jgi:hypothetical protein
MKKVLFTILLCLSITGNAFSAVTYSYVDLIKKLTDLESLATLPAKGETCQQFSSYERTSKYDTQTGKYVAWDANGDHNGIIRTEGDLQVMAEMKGPGCITRIWSAYATSGHVKIYLDGASEPAVDLPFSGYFDCTNEPFIYPSLVHDAASGKNCYVPIPYQKSCKIVAEKDWGAYYQFTYTTFPKGTIVPTFKRNLSAEESAALRGMDFYLRYSLGRDPSPKRQDQTELASSVSVNPGQTVTVARIQGARAITALRMNITQSSLSEDMLRNVILRIYWDGEKSPSVWAPIGDFFGSGIGAHKYKSLPLGVTTDSFYSYWYMPFANSAVIELKNEGDTAFTAPFSITTADLTQPVDTLGRFHAKWHRDAMLPEEPERAIDWTMLKTEGRGRFCGVALEVWNPRGGWWGEGDEKFFVDGEKFPSTIGTGSEDYFGYAWCNPMLFYNAFHNQPRNDNINNASHIVVNRWQIADNVPFQKSFEGAIEKYFPNNRQSLDACMVYWYLSPKGEDLYQPVAAADRKFYIEPEVYRVPGVLEAERLEIAGKTGGITQVQPLDSFQGQWSAGNQIWWTEARPGDKLDITLSVEKAGKYGISAQFTKAADYGIVQMWIDGKKLGDSLDLYNDGVIPSGEISLGTVELTAGDHTITAEITGANSNAKGYMIGIDYVRLKPIQ